MGSLKCSGMHTSFPNFEQHCEKVDGQLLQFFYVGRRLSKNNMPSSGFSWILLDRLSSKIAIFFSSACTNFVKWLFFTPVIKSFWVDKILLHSFINDTCRAFRSFAMYIAAILIAIRQVICAYKLLPYNCSGRLVLVDFTFLHISRIETSKNQTSRNSAN